MIETWTSKFSRSTHFWNNPVKVQGQNIGKPYTCNVLENKKVIEVKHDMHEGGEP